MSNYHTSSLKNADIFMVMGSIYAEVVRYDSALSSKQNERADQAIARAKELIDYSLSLDSLNEPQKKEIQIFSSLLNRRVKQNQKSNLDSYLMPFAIGARLRQIK